MVRASGTIKSSSAFLPIMLRSGEKHNGEMTSKIKDLLLAKIETASEFTLKEVLDFLLFLEAKAAEEEQLEISLLSEASLAEYWSTPEEDEAWQHL